MKSRPSDSLNTSTNAERLHDVGSFLTKAVVSIIAPVGGGILTEAFGLIVTDPAIRRRDKFLMDVDERLTEMEQAGFIRLGDIENSEEISALLLQAVQTATRSSGERKLQALKEIVVRGVTAREAAGASHAQVMLALVDRMTEHHIIALHWHSAPRRAYTLGQLESNSAEGAWESLHYGQPVQNSREGLIDPVSVYYQAHNGFGLYVEGSSKVAFEVAEADLIALGLTKHVYQFEEYVEGRTRKRRKTDKVIGSELTELGKHLLRYISLIEEQR